MGRGGSWCNSGFVSSIFRRLLLCNKKFAVLYRVEGGGEEESSRYLQENIEAHVLFVSIRFFQLPLDLNENVVGFSFIFLLSSA